MEAELWIRGLILPILHLLLWENKSSITRVSNYARYSRRRAYLEKACGWWHHVDLGMLSVTWTTMLYTPLWSISTVLYLNPEHVQTLLVYRWQWVLSLHPERGPVFQKVYNGWRKEVPKSHPASNTSLGFCPRRSSKATHVIERADFVRSIIPDNRMSSARTLQCMAIEKNDAVAVLMQVCTHVPHQR